MDNQVDEFLRIVASIDKTQILRMWMTTADGQPCRWFLRIVISKTISE